MKNSSDSLESDAKSGAQLQPIVDLPPIMHLPPLVKGLFHPEALYRYLTFLEETIKATPELYNLREEDAKAFLSGSEYTRFEGCENQICAWLQKCRNDSDQIALAVYPCHSPFNAMWDLKKFIAAVAERKAEKLIQEATNRNRLKAIEAINPPLADAKKYLTQPQYDQFIKSLPGAADAYIDGGKNCILGDWLLDTRAGAYLLWTKLIKDGKEEELRYQQAEQEYMHFIADIRRTIEKFKLDLSKEKMPSFSYLLSLAKYDPGNWCKLELPTSQDVEYWTRPQILKRVPQVLRDIVDWNLDYQVQTLPYAKYELVGVPCLTWCFRILLLAKVTLRLSEKTFIKKFRGHQRQIQVHTDELGWFYLGPVEWDDQVGFITPLRLLVMLSEDAVEADGIEVMEHDGSTTGYYIRGYDEAFCRIQEQFRQFIIDVTQGKTLAAGLRARGVVDDIIAKLVDEKAKLPLPQNGTEADVKANGDGDGDVIAALENMGYSKTEIEHMVEATHLAPEMSFGEKVKAILKNMGS